MTGRSNIWSDGYEEHSSDDEFSCLSALLFGSADDVIQCIESRIKNHLSTLQIGGFLLVNFAAVNSSSCYLVNGLGETSFSHNFGRLIECILEYQQIDHNSIINRPSDFGDKDQKFVFYFSLYQL